MARYTVHVPVKPDVRAEALERAVFVRDGWSWGAFLFGPFWLLWHRHWITGLLAVALVGALVAGLFMLPVSDGVKTGAMLLVMVLAGLEGPSLRRLALARAGFAEEGLVVGGNLDTLEQRFFAETGEKPLASPAASESAAAIAGSARPWGGPVIGLFPDSRKPS